MVLYRASDKRLPIIKAPVYPKDMFDSPDWPDKAQPFHTAELAPEVELVRHHFTFPYVLYAGSYEGCGCGFNCGREYPANDEKHLQAAKRSVDELVKYIQEAAVRQIYSCWSTDEAQPTNNARTASLNEIASNDFFFRERELLNLASE